MHRSGTSALTEVLVRAGAWFGPPSLAAQGRPRPLGLVERTDFLALSEAAIGQPQREWAQRRTCRFGRWLGEQYS